MPDRFTDFEKGDLRRTKAQLQAEVATALERATPMVTATPRVPRQDLVIVLSEDTPEVSNAIDAARQAPHGRFVRAGTRERLTERLKRVDYPIDRLVLMSHGTREADVRLDFGGDTHSIPATDLADILKSSIDPRYYPRSIELRGCSTGRNPAGMETIRAAVGARSISGINCFWVYRSIGPVIIDDTPITEPSQITDRGAFERGLDQLVESFGEAKQCIVDHSEDAYFRAGGRLLAIWAHPEWSPGDWWDFRSVCLKDLPVRTVDPSKRPPEECALIKVTK